MSGAEHGADGVADSTDAMAGGAMAPTGAEGAASADAAEAAPAGRADLPAPLASLTSLLGGTIEGGTACATDGSCD